jgi:hypothetical protein
VKQSRKGVSARILDCFVPHNDVDIAIYLWEYLIIRMKYPSTLLQIPSPMEKIPNRYLTNTHSIGEDPHQRYNETFSPWRRYTKEV